MKINPVIFRAYDIRGIYPYELNEKSAYLIGRAFAVFLNKKKAKIVVGRDNRLSSPKLFKALARGITDEGAQVIDIGLAFTPLLYWACGYYKYDAGINITASHNPTRYNGFKMVKKGALPVSEKTGLKEIQELTGKEFHVTSKKPKIFKKQILKDYLEFNFKGFKVKDFQKMKIVIDTANAVPAILIPKLKKRLDIEIYPLFEKLDGSFPNHNPDPLVEENLIPLKKEALKRKAALGAAFDGDGDRLVFVDEKGRTVSGDLLSAFLAERILKDKPKSKILYDIRCSNIVKETISANGGKPVLSRVGHSFIKEKMRQEKVLFGGELSGHFFHRDHYFCEAPLFVLLKVIEILSQEQKPFSKLILPYRKYFHSGEINFEVRDKERILKRLEYRYQGGKISTLDGVRIDFPDWWFLVRPSNTEPKLRLIIEAKTKKLLQEKQKELTKLISSR